MNIKFSKYQGTGNDFIIIDNRTLLFNKQQSDLIKSMCHRRFGVGADGLILLENDSTSDFRMVYFNADGLESTMCGNGGRCIVAFANELGLVINNKTSFSAIDGLHEAEILKNNLIKLQMNSLSKIEKIEKNTFFLNTGSPHVVKIVNELPHNFIEQAKLIRHSKRFNEKGVNVNFIQIRDTEINIRTFERGVEDETYSCGTGAVAAAIVVNKFFDKHNIELTTKGGQLSVEFHQNKIFLIGMVQKIYTGVLT